MLAVKVVLGEVDDVDTLVFDEVDAGVGGSTAVALADVAGRFGAHAPGDRPSRHLAQVAVRGQAHYVVPQGCGDEGPCPKPTCGGCPKASVPPKSARYAVGRCYRDIACARARMLARAARIA